MTRLLAVALPIVLLSLVSQATGARATFPGRDGAIVFESDREGDFDLYFQSSAAEVARRIPLPTTDEFNAAWSPSGNRLVFETGRRGGDSDVALVNADGTGLTTLVGGPTSDFGAQFCDENTVVFTRQETPTNTEVYRVETNGSGLTRLTDHPARDSFPACSPVDSGIALISFREGGVPGIFGLNLDGGNVRRLVPGVGLDPDFSPDGRSLAYVAPDADRNLELSVLTLADGSIRQVTSSSPPLDYRQPEFFPSSTPGAPKFLVTLRNSQTGAKEVRSIVAGAQTTIAVPGSGASAQPRRRCRCQNVDAVIEPNSLDIISENRGGVRLRGRLRWTLDCTFGTTGCSSGMQLTAARKDVRFVLPRTRLGNELEVFCRGLCARRTRGRQTFQLLGRGAHFGRDRRGTKVGSVTIVLRRPCNQRELRPREFIVVFTRDGGIDRSRSDLNGDRKPDGRN